LGGGQPSLINAVHPAAQAARKAVSASGASEIEGRCSR
jgi:hypothetical protein